MLLILKKSYSWLKHKWYIPVIGVLVVIAWVVLRGRPDALLKLLESSKESHRKEVKALDQINAEEIGKREKALRMSEAAIRQVEESYKENLQEFEKDKRKQIKKLVAENHDDPEALAKKIASTTGFSVVFPEED